MGYVGLDRPGEEDWALGTDNAHHTHTTPDPLREPTASSVSEKPQQLLSSNQPLAMQERGLSAEEKIQTRSVFEIL